MKYFAINMLALSMMLAVGLSFAHAKDAPQPTRGEAGDVLTPLAMGNTWVYENTNAGLISTDRIEGVVAFDGKPWHLLRSYERAIDQPATKDESINYEYWLALIDGYECDTFMQIDEETQTLKPATINRAHRLPATLGDTYHPYADNKDATVTILALNEKITTKAGDFDCIVYKETSAQDETISFTSYVAPGVGVIKSIYTEDGESHTLELISYTFSDNN